MNKVVTVSLKGMAYHLEETGYNALRHYIDRAEAQLKNAADRLEVIGDLEQAIGEKCAARLNAGKTTVSADDIAEILKEVGPVQDVDGQPFRSDPEPPPPRYAEASSNRSTPRHKRLFRVPSASTPFGVCNGLAAYLGINVIFVRIFFICTTPAAFPIYIIMLFLMPIAYTEEDLAAAHAFPPRSRH